MKSALREAIAQWRYGDAVIVVSGLPRSGTSMLMNMLNAGGMEVLVDGRRLADDDNPRGYFEHDRVKDLESDRDRAWVRAARGKAIKVISHLLRSLPGENRYRILLATRELREVLASQNRMLARAQKPNPVDDEKALRLFRQHLKNVRSLVGVRGNFEMIEVPYAEVIRDPRAWTSRIATFVGRRLDEERMAGVVEARLYRNRVARSLATN
jgi:hypothetical protein